MSQDRSQPVFDAQFLQLLFRRLHGVELPDGDAAGLSGMIEPVEVMARRAVQDMQFDAEPADYQRVLGQQRSGGDGS